MIHRRTYLVIALPRDVVLANGQGVTVVTTVTVGVEFPADEAVEFQPRVPVGIKGEPLIASAEPWVTMVEMTVLPGAVTVVTLGA